MAEYSYEEFLTVHEPQLLTSAVPDIFWPTLYEKLKTSDLNSGQSFQLIVEQDEEGENQNYSVVALNDLSVDDPNNIYLIDHCYTFRLNTAREALQEVPGLKERLMEAFGIKVEDLIDTDEIGSDYIGSETGDARPKPPRTSESRDDEHDSDNSSAASSIAELDGKIINAILEKLPQYMQTYTIKLQKKVLDNNDMAFWFLNDEFGMRIGHSMDPNFRIIPFYYSFERIAYSLLFPLKNIATGEEISRNYVEGLLLHTHPTWYSVLRLPWQNVDLTNEPITFSHKDDSYFLDGRIPDQINSLKVEPASDPNGILDTIKIYATDDQLLKHLRAVSFEIVDNIYEADVIWSHDHFHDFTSLAERNPHALVNQFPFESSLTVKDLFATCVQSCPEFEKSFDEEKLEWKFPGFYPATFNLNEEMPAFVTYFQKRAQRNLENSFIVKPWNLARGLDTFITKDLNYVIRLAETGPKLAQKYIENPVLFRRPDSGRIVKFDLRYIVFVRSLNPLDIHLYKDFWPRCAINDYDLQNLDDILSHLSVFNYSDKEKVLNIQSVEFIDCLQKLHPQIKWNEVQEKIDHVIREVVKIAAHNKPPRGMSPNSQSRGMYGFDIMLQWKDGEQKEVHVTFLEANFIPDCSRACEFYPDFADTVFQTLFLGGGSERTRKI